MNADLIKGVFAVYVVGVSFIRLLVDNEYFRLTAMKKTFGRRRGLLYHFLSNVIVPMLFALIYICKGVVAASVL